MARVFFDTFHATAQKALSDYSALKLPYFDRNSWQITPE
jgi:hypothetical protein